MNILARALVPLVIFSSLMLAGCGGGGSSPASDPPDPVDVSGLLKPVGSAAAFEASLKAGLSTIGTTTAADSEAAASADGFTTTYTQEENVDEFDVVKYDGEHLYIAPQRGDDKCCFALAAADAPPGDIVAAPEPSGQRSIRVLATDPGTARAAQIASIEITDDKSVQGMYLYPERLVALMTATFRGRFGQHWVDTASWAAQATSLVIYDTSNASLPTPIFEAEIEGAFVESRRVDNTVYLVTRHTPTIDGLNYYVTTAEEQASNEATLASVTLDEMLPHVTVNGVASTLFDPASCYVSNDAADPGYPVITSITAVPIDDPEAHRTFCYNESTYGVYVSETAIYLSQYQFEANRRDTRLHKFAFADNGLDYRGSADIDGLLWSGGQADFRISEHAGYIRAVTTEPMADNSDAVDHHLFVLAESGTSLSLDLVSRLPNDNQTEEIGKPNEQLYGVRFFADRAYAVTFERIDPLYVIDLADPAQPRIAGQLEVTGFSDFLHPVSDDLLLALGQADTGGIKLELFDIADIANPMSLGSDVLGASGAYSEARYDRHAFTYRADVDATTDRFIIPADLYTTGGSYQLQVSGLYFYEIRNKQTPDLASLDRVGSLLVDSATTGQPVFVAGRNRSILHDDTVFYVRDEDVWSTFWMTPGVVNGPF
jgi:hypothetical protein